MPLSLGLLIYTVEIITPTLEVAVKLREGVQAHGLEAQA